MANRGARRISLRATVLVPGAAFVLTALLTRIPMELLKGGSIPSPVWVLAWLPSAAGILMLVGVLNTIRAIVDLSVPDLRVSVDRDPDPWSVGKQYRIRLRAALEHGQALAQTQLVLFVPPEINYGGDPIWRVPGDDFFMPGYSAIASTRWDYKALAPFQWEFHHLTPTKPGALKFYYAVYGPTYTTEPVQVSISIQQ